jgi:hypothetical protein
MPLSWRIAFRPFNDRVLNRDLALVCDRVNQASPRLLGVGSPSPFIPRVALLLHRGQTKYRDSLMKPRTKNFVEGFIQTKPFASGKWCNGRTMQPLSGKRIQNVPARSIDLFTARNLFFKRVQMALNLLFEVFDRTILNRNEGQQLS